MAVRYTRALREIINFIEKHDFITINIATRMFYKDKRNGYEQARVKLVNMYNNKMLTRYESITGEYIYQLKKKQVSDHRRYTIEAYSRINQLVDEILYFTREASWICDKFRNDAHIIYRKGEEVGAFLIEFEKYSKTKPEKIQAIYESNEVQEWYKENFEEEYFPPILLITETGTSRCKGKEWTSCITDYKFSNLEALL